jgi:4a-hydroxytetrahydrobiopterin dehydratase
MSPERLVTADLDAALDDLPDVHRSGAGNLVVQFQLPGFVPAVRLIDQVAAVAEEMDHHPDVDLRYRTVTFTLSTHSEGGVTELDLTLARRILQLAEAASAQPVAPSGRLEIALDAAEPAVVRDFWRVGLGYAEQTTEDGEVELRSPDGRGPVLWFQTMDPPRPGRGRFHLDTYLPDETSARERVAATVAAGGRLVSEEHAPDWWVLADAEGNELCICQPH